MMKLQTLILLTALTCSLQTRALDFEFAGYVGNSGTAKKPVLVGVDPKQPHWDYARHVTKRGNPYRDLCMGPIYDKKTGLIYATAGYASINAYALDGRQIATYTLPKRYGGLSSWEKPRLNRTGEFLIMFTGNRHDKSIYKLPLNAPDGAVLQKVAGAGRDTRTISISSRNGKCLVLKTSGDIYTFDPSNDTFTQLCSIGDFDVSMIDWTPDGNMICRVPRGDVKFIRSVGGQYKVIDSTAKISGGGFTITGKYAWACGGGTVNRYSFPSLSPDPGVVFGGASGSFLGTVVMNREMDSSYGITQIKENLFAIASGNSQIIHFAQWNDVRKKLVLVRRIGAIPWINTLLVDGSGNILVNRFVWQWGNDSLSPLSDNYRDYIYESVCLGNDIVVNFGLGYDHGKRRSVFAARSSRLLECAKLKACWAPDFKIPANPVGSSAFKVGRQQFAMLLDASGAATSYKVGHDGTVIKGSQTNVSLRLRKAGKVSALAGIDDTKALIAVDGSLVELKGSSNSWQEQRRWETQFSPGCKIAVDGGRVFVTEKDKNLLSAYSLSSRSLIAKLTIDTPTKISVNGSRLVVFEEKNQRVSKYNLHD